VKVERPRSATYDAEQRCVRLHFPTNPSARYIMRGGIAWPFAHQSGTDMTVRGYAVLLGQHCRSKHLTVFEFTEFRTVDNLLTPDGEMKHKGIAAWFNANWTNYAARDYWWHESGVVNLRYRQAVQRCVVIEPKPRFREAKWSDQDGAEHIIWQTMAEERLTMPPVLVDALRAGQANPEHPCPEKHALLCALASYEQKPWKPVEKRLAWERI